MSAELSKAYYEHQNIATTKAHAKLQLDLAKAEKREEIDKLRRELSKMGSDFEDHWKAEKDRLAQVRDELAKQELANGVPATTILKELGSRNTVWIYTLKAEVEKGGYTPSAKEETPAVKDSDEWLYHDFKGTHSYAFSKDFTKLKKHGIIGTPDEGLYFVADYGPTTFEFLYGDREFFDKQPKGELLKRTQQLDEILNDVYSGKVVLEENPYKSL